MIENKVFKTLVGKNIYGIPLSNSVKRGTPLREQIKEFLVIKVARVNVIISDSGRDGATYKKEGLSNHNCGYDFYETLELADGYFVISDLQKRLSQSYNLGINFSQATRINEILDENN